MTAEQQRIAIAEACGWKFQKGEAETYGALYKAEGFFNPQGEFMRDCPDYLNDLNAMHQAERTALVVCKDGHKWRDYRNEYKDLLWHLCAPIRSGEKTGWGFPEFATAKIKSEAFLRTLGLWQP